MIDLPQPTGSDLWQPPDELAPLHRPVRALVALGEVIVAAVLIWLAFVCWGHAHTDLTVISADGARLVSTRWFGNWLAGALGLGILSVLLLVDAVRQLSLAIRARHRKPKQSSHS